MLKIKDFIIELSTRFEIGLDEVTRAIGMGLCCGVIKIDEKEKIIVIVSRPH